ACGGPWSCQAVSDQELERAVEADMGQGGSARRARGRAEPHKTEVSLVRIAAARAPERRRVGREQGIGIVRKIARKHRSIGLAAERFGAGALAGGRGPENAREAITRALDRRLAGRADGGKRD